MITAALAGRLRQLHHAASPLLLPNVWDVASARLLEELGFPAVATSSAAIANSLGYPDGQRISRAEMLAVIARIASAVRIPVTADMEAGYGDDLDRCARELVASGAVGLNLEDAEHDALLPLDRQLRKIERLLSSAAKEGVPLVLNARCDAFFVPEASGAVDAFSEALSRGEAYRRAGADCIFLPGLRDLATVRRFLADCPGPLNLLGGPGLPGVAELAAAGVRRISLGSGPYRAALGLLRRIAEDLRGGGFAQLTGAVPYAEVNAWLG